MKMKVMFLLTPLEEMDFPLTFTGNMALGWMMRFSSSIAFRVKIKWRKILMPPEVDPEQPPINISINRMVHKKVGQAM